MIKPRGDWMQTFSGEAFYPLSPRIEEVHAEDIAHALSLICRYGGHVKKFYSVAEHCVLLSRSVETKNALWALLHDATEAYLGDMVRPLKQSMPHFVAAEEHLMRVICFKFSMSTKCPDEVKEADTRILLDEKSQLMNPSLHVWTSLVGMEPLGIDVHGWEPAKAESLFLERLNELH